MTTQSLKDRVILVTGAGSGLGREAALAFAAQGATVLLLGRNEERLNAVFDTIKNAGHPEPAIIPFDVAETEPQRFEQLASTIAWQMKRLDGILHSAGRFIPLGPLSDQHLDQWRDAFNTNLFGAFAVTRACLPLLLKSPDASVLFTMEEHGLDVARYWGGFGMSQQGLLPLMRLFAREHEGKPNLRFNLMIPGAVASPMRIRTHPGEINQNQRPAQDLMAVYCDWMGPLHRGQSGEVIRP
jgi:NAD(P)-dependent dehydrogenase (short-subunit alcohol dehydrogenase family)